MELLIGAIICLMLLSIILNIHIGVDNSKKKGYDAGIKGVPVEACPYLPLAPDDYFNTVNRKEWISGWQEGFLKRGLTAEKN